MTSKILKDNLWIENGAFRFVEWLANFDEQHKKDSIEFDGTRARIDEFVYDETNELWIVRFMKLRDSNIPSKVKESEDSQVFELEDDEYIGEDVTLLYDEETGLTMIQSNRFALGVGKIERFIARTPLVPDEQVEIHPISTKIDTRNFKRRNYRQLELKFANLHQLPLKNKNTALGDILKSFNRFGGVTGTITISLGRSKYNSLRRSEVEAVLQDISDNLNVEGAKIKVKDDDSSPVEIIDLFDNIDNDILTFELPARASLDFKITADKMTKQFLKRLPDLKEKIGVVSN
jgi:hypothetical protein